MFKYIWKLTRMQRFILWAVIAATAIIINHILNGSEDSWNLWILI